jgi:tungstate transport system substrate-binding protein
MSFCRTILSSIVIAFLCVGQAAAQERTIAVGVPAGPLVQLVQTLAPVFQAQTGIATTAMEMNPAASLPAVGADAVLLPDRVLRRLQPTGNVPPRVIFFGDAVLVGSRAEMARVRGLKDIKTALRWIASARGTYMSSSPSLGTRELELSLWNSIGVNVQTRTSWYLEGRGDEASVLRQAGRMGAYVLVERMTWAAQNDRQGLEVLVTGDPVLRTAYASQLVRETSQEARAWFDWLSSEQARTVISNFSLNGVRVFTPATGSDAESSPSRT